MELKIGGIAFPFNFLVIEKLGFDCILGMDLFQQASAIIDTKNNVLQLFDGLTSIPMSKTGDHVIVRSIASISILPYSKAIFPVRTKQKTVTGRNYMIEGEAQIPSSSVSVARTLVDASQNRMPCRVMNISSKTVTLRAGTPIGILTPVQIDKSTVSVADKKQSDREVTKNEMLAALETKSISLSDTALQGEDLDNLIRLLYDNLDLFSVGLSDLPGTDILLHRIDTGDSPPVQKKSYRHSPADQAEISRQTTEMLKAGIISPSDTPWSSPVILISKKDNTKRFVVDYRMVNRVTCLTSWPLLTLDEIIDTVSERRRTLWSSLDLRQGFHQICLDSSTAFKTGFCTRDGNVIYNRLPFGLTGSSQFFQMAMMKIFKSMTPSATLIYLDDILLLGQNPEDMLLRIQQAFELLRKANLRLHGGKCHFATAKVRFLGHIFSPAGISVDPDKIEIVKAYPIPCNQRHVKSYLGLVAYFRKFIRSISQITAPLRELLKDGVRFKWTPECQKSFDTLKDALTTAPILALPNFKRRFSLHTDASYTGLSYILMQKDHQERERVICYGGRSLKPNETHWTVSEIECLAIIEGVKCYHTYLAGNAAFDIVSDHAALACLAKSKLSSNNRLTRWALFLQSYNYNFIHKPGRLLTAADAISRIPRDPETGKICQVERPDTNAIQAN